MCGCCVPACPGCECCVTCAGGTVAASGHRPCHHLPPGPARDHRAHAQATKVMAPTLVCLYSVLATRSGLQSRKSSHESRSGGHALADLALGCHNWQPFSSNFPRTRAHRRRFLCVCLPCGNRRHDAVRSVLERPGDGEVYGGGSYSLSKVSRKFCRQNNIYHKHVIPPREVPLLPRVDCLPLECSRRSFRRPQKIRHGLPSSSARTDRFGGAQG